MPLAFLLIFGGALLVYMGWKNESLPGIFSDTLSPLSGPTQSQQDFVGGNPFQTIGNDVTSGINAAVSGLGKSYFQGWHIGRRDQGVDIGRVSPGTSLPAIGTSKVVGVIPNWYKGQPYVWLQALDGPLAGRFYYYSEQITNIAPVGTVLQDRAPVAYYANSGTGVEAGLATKSGQTLARATTGYTEGQATPAADLFMKLIGLTPANPATQPGHR